MLMGGAASLGVEVSTLHVRALTALSDLLLKWNLKVNLTAIRDPSEVQEKHLLDSLAVAPMLEGIGSLVDIGSGAGFPGLPLKIIRPGWRVVLVDSVAKKVAFMKQAVVTLGLKDARAVHLHASGSAEADGLERSDAVISRAFTDVDRWLPFARGYARPGGKVVAMLGKDPGAPALRASGVAAGMELVEHRAYRLPYSGAERAVAVYVTPS
jgi:16S rRNA (guanine527-N7)-methyltransferase